MKVQAFNLALQGLGWEKHPGPVLTVIERHYTPLPARRQRVPTVSAWDPLCHRNSGPPTHAFLWRFSHSAGGWMAAEPLWAQTVEPGTVLLRGCWW